MNGHGPTQSVRVAILTLSKPLALPTVIANL